MQLLLFIVLSIAAIGGALGVVLSKNPVHSALSLLVNFAVLAVFYIMLHAQFLAVVQIIVYAGAIVVLFLFVIMLIGGEVRLFGQRARARVVASAIAVGAGVIFLGGLAILASRGDLAPATGELLTSGSVQAIGEALFTRYLLPFELASVLLLAAMIGAVVLARASQTDPSSDA